MPIFINDPAGVLTIESFRFVTKISPDKLEIEFEGQDNSFFVSLLPDGNLKIVKVSKKESNNTQIKKLISSLANEIIVC